MQVRHDISIFHTLLRDRDKAIANATAIFLDLLTISDLILITCPQFSLPSLPLIEIR